MSEPFEYVQYWLVAMPPRFQVWHQSEAERYFDWYIEQIKQCQGVEVSPVERKMQFLKDQDDHEYAIRYSQRVEVTGAEERLQNVMDMMNVS